MRTLPLCLFILALSIAIPQNTMAQTNGEEHPLAPEISRHQLLRWQEKLESGQTYYDRALQNAQQKQGDFKGAIASLRSNYGRTYDYTPFSKRIIEELTRLAFVADTSKDTTERNRTLNSYRSLLNKHLANINVVEFALTMSRANVMFGDEFFLKKVFDALYDDFYSDRDDGLTPATAYSIVTYGEESYILGEIGGELINSEVYKAGNRYFNVHSMNLPNGDFTQIYVDITTPVMTVYYQKAQKDTVTDIPNTPTFR